ncbi:response regulator [Methylocella sp.]|uniref:response regulator n=1 Tax=Methylocella sp. TaxID=1978226 RepID=UPI0035B12274
MSENAAHPLILVVEDEPLVRMFGADVLEGAGFCVIEAANADEALSVLAQRSDVAAVVTDVEMPGSLDGLDLAWRIKDRWPRIGVVLTSGRWSRRRGEIPNGGAFVPKPYASSTLLSEVEAVIRHARRVG